MFGIKWPMKFRIDNFKMFQISFKFCKRNLSPCAKIAKWKIKSLNGFVMALIRLTNFLIKYSPQFQRYGPPLFFQIRDLS